VVSNFSVFWGFTTATAFGILSGLIMGVAIRYRGKLRDINELVALCDELTMVADKMDWSYRRLDEDWSKPSSASIEAVEKGARIKGHLPLKGITLAVHPRCESLSLFL
jgi:hypothetical protein